jgi:hypothetical protein
MPRGVYERKKKGKWSKIAREKHSVRMKERWKAKNGHKAPTNGQVLTIGQRLDLIEDQCARIREQISMFKA